MSIRSFCKKTPQIAGSAYIDESAILIGDVTVGEDSSLWPLALVRGDVHSIRIGKMTNIQDGCILHVSHDGVFNPGGAPLVVGDGVTVGHRVTLHGCTVGDHCLLGMSSTVMDGALLEGGLIIGAHSLVPANRHLQAGYLYVGSPAKQIRPLSEKERDFLEYSAQHYVQLKAKYIL